MTDSLIECKKTCQSDPNCLSIKFEDDNCTKVSTAEIEHPTPNRIVLVKCGTVNGNWHSILFFLGCEDRTLPRYKRIMRSANGWPVIFQWYGKNGKNEEIAAGYGTPSEKDTNTCESKCNELGYACIGLTIFIDSYKGLRWYCYPIPNFTPLFVFDNRRANLTFSLWKACPRRKFITI